MELGTTGRFMRMAVWFVRMDCSCICATNLQYHFIPWPVFVFAVWRAFVGYLRDDLPRISIAFLRLVRTERLCVLFDDGPPFAIQLAKRELVLFQCVMGRLVHLVFPLTDILVVTSDLLPSIS